MRVGDRSRFPSTSRDFRVLIRGSRVLVAAFLCALSAGRALAQPRIDAISPTQGPIAGGTIVTVSGTGFSGASVALDQAPFTPASITDTQIQLTMPAHDNGYALIQVSAGGMSSAVEFLYVPPKLEDLPAGYITTVAGVGKYLRLELPATRSMLTPSDLTIAANGDIYFMQTDRGLLFRVDAEGILHHVAGTLGTFDWEFIGDGGPAKEAVFGFSHSVALDAAGNAYITDARARIRKVEAATGIVTTIAGTGEEGYSGDGGPATQARIGQPSHIACTPDGTLFFIDGLPIEGGVTPRNLRVRRVMPDGIISTIAGNGLVGDEGDGGPAVAASLNIGYYDDGDIALDAARNVFILEADGERIRRIDAQTGVITLFASLALEQGRKIGRSAIATDAAGNVYVGTSWNFLKYDPTGRLLESWGTDHGYTEDGSPARQMKVGGSLGLAIASNGDIIFSDITVPRVRRIRAATETLETIAGMGPDVIGVPGDALGAVLTSPSGDLAFLPSGDLIFGDGLALRMYRINPRTGTIVPFAGTGGFFGGYEGRPALETGIYPIGIEVDAQGTVYFADKETIRSIDPDGIVHRIAGLPYQYGFSGDGGPARDALLCQPGDVTLDRSGDLFIADTNNNRIRRVDAKTGLITTVAGSGPSSGYEGYGRGSWCGDGGAALNACFNSPIGVAVRDDGSMVISDWYSYKVREVSSDGIVSTVPWPLSMKLIVGPGQSIFGHGLHRIYRADDGEACILVGSEMGFSGDGGPATEAKMAAGEAELALGLAIDAEGNLFFHDAGSRRIRAVRYGAVLSPPNPIVVLERGSGQTTALGTTFTIPFEVSVKASSASSAPGVRVDFQAPSSGPSCVFANGTTSMSVLTGRDGIAQAICRASGGIGSFDVTATPLGSGVSVTIHLTNTALSRRRGVRR